MRLVATVASFHQINMAFAKLPKPFDGRPIKPILHWEPQGHAILVGQQVLAGHISFLDEFLHVEPVGSIFLPVVDNENHRHPLVLPQLQVGALDAKGDAFPLLRSCRESVALT